MFLPGDIVFLEREPPVPYDIECIVMEVDQEKGTITKFKAANPDPLLAKIGFIKEGQDYVRIAFDICRN